MLTRLALPLLLLSLLLTARSSIAEPDVQGPAPGQEALDFQKENLSPELILDQAIERREQGDLDGAEARLLYLETLGDSSIVPGVLYQSGILHEHREDFVRALSYYDLLVGGHPRDPVARDGWFRRALCLEYLGRHREARKSLDQIPTEDGLDYNDRLTLDLQRGILLVRQGRLHKGLSLLDTTLKATENAPQGQYLRAKGYVTRAEAWVQASNRLTLNGSQRRSVRHLKARAELLSRAQAEVAAALVLQVPEWALEGLLTLGAGYEQLAVDLVAIPPPRNLSEEQQVYYHQELERKAQILRTKAWSHYDAGLTVAAQLQYRGRPLPAIKAAKEALKLEP